jgi:hypothetical protein
MFLRSAKAERSDAQQLCSKLLIHVMLDGMRRIIVKSLIAVALIAVAIGGWIIGARPLSILVDRAHTVQVDSQPVTELGIDDVSGGMIRINSFLMNIEMPDNRPFPMTMATDAQGRFGVTINGRLVALGSVADSAEGSSRRVVRPEPGDRATLSISRSFISWPTPFDFNFMSGHSPSSKRHMYYRLLWHKSDGAELEMLWRYEQYFYGSDGWASGFMTRQGSTGLLRAKIQP